MGPGLFAFVLRVFLILSLLLSHWAFSGLLIKNGFVVVTEQESERHWQAEWTVTLQL